MAALFDGVTALLNEVFGEEITHFDRAGGAQSVVSVFRKTPVKVTDEQGGAFLLSSPWWRVSQDALPERPREGDEIAAPDGNRYRILNVWENGAAAADAHLICELEVIA